MKSFKRPTTASEQTSTAAAKGSASVGAASSGGAKASGSAWKSVGSVRKSKNGNFYLKFNQAVTLGADESLLLQDPRKKLDDAVASGRLSEEAAEEKKAKIPEYIEFDIVQPPPRMGEGQ